MWSLFARSELRGFQVGQDFCRLLQFGFAFKTNNTRQLQLFRDLLNGRTPGGVFITPLSRRHYIDMIIGPTPDQRWRGQLPEDSPNEKLRERAQDAASQYAQGLDFIFELGKEMCPAAPELREKVLDGTLTWQEYWKFVGEHESELSALVYHALTLCPPIEPAAPLRVVSRKAKLA